jgi:hypothetical protein
MSIYGRFASLVLVVLSVVILQGCEEEVTGPGSGSGKMLEATVDGTKLVFTLPTDTNALDYPIYNTTAHEVSINTTLTGLPTKSVNIFFTFNVDSGTLPSTVTGSDARLYYIVLATSGSETYNSLGSGGSCSVTVTARNGDIIDGTFQGDLVKTDDPTRKISIRDGKFSVKFKRQS